MDIVSTATAHGLGELHLARVGPDPRRLIEFVDTLEPGIPKARKWVLMISTQAGCAVGCSLCDAGELGYWGNLTAEEMLGQVRFVLRRNPELDPARHPKLKVHFARMGEPSLNPAVLEALRRLPELVGGAGLLPSLSSVAPLAPVTERFFEELATIKDDRYPAGRFQLQFSLHATDEESRRRIVPVRTWDFARIAEYGRRFRRPGDRKITLNFATPEGHRLDAARLARAFDPADFLVKITPVNPTRRADDSGHTRVWQEPPADIAGFAARLKERGFEVILSPSLPEEIAAATSCGQLWSGALREQARVRRRNLEREARAYVRPGELAAKTAEWLAAVAPYRRERQGPPPEPALLVVDMQEFFLNPRSPAFLPPARAVAERVAALVARFREAGRPVAFTTHAYEEGERAGAPMARWWRKACLAGSPDARILPLLGPREGEPVLRKTRYSAFSHPELEPWLRARGARAARARAPG
ncbi:MAG: isochorismatase family protein, partial [Elusimicrobia bacterium]|nr:isochorismatase family protein [Elusimicrobiota bacterium]